MHTVTTRVYDVDAEGRKVLLHRPGDVITDSEAKRVAGLEYADRLSDETPPPKQIDRMTLGQLREVCAAEGIDPGDANLRAEFVKVICAARGQRRSNPTNER